MKKLFLFLLYGMLCAASCSENVKLDDDNTMASGTAGVLTWTLCKDGTLTISGKGEIPDYSHESFSPWHEYRDGVTSVITGNEVSKIGEYAFYQCSNMTSVTIGSSVTIIGDGAFRMCGITEIIIYQEIPPTIDNDNRVFGFLYYTDIKLFVPNSSMEAYRSAPGWKNFLIIGAIDTPSPVMAAGVETTAYMGMPLFIWRLYNDGTLVINGSSMPGYNSMLSQGAGVGYGFAPWYYNEEHRNSITSVIIEEGMVNIGKQAFYQCSNINSITIPSSVIDISNEATFTGCQNITKIINYRVDHQMISGEVFKDVNKTECTLFVPVGSEDVYRSADGWADFINIKMIQ